MNVAEYAIEEYGLKPCCPDCDGVELRRHSREGFVQRTVLPRFGVFPWECGLCRKIFLLKQRAPRPLAPVFEAGRSSSAKMLPFRPAGISIGEPTS